jgi:hypothetical protein
MDAPPHPRAAPAHNPNERVDANRTFGVEANRKTEEGRRLDQGLIVLFLRVSPRASARLNLVASAAKISKSCLQRKPRIRTRREVAMASKLLARQAVVVGAGMGGLTAARVLADCFEHVTVLERDTLPTDTSHRSGTPQSKHVHALLGGGQRALSDLFPGVEHDLARAGAVPFRVGLDVRVETPRHDPFPRRDLGWI